MHVPISLFPGNRFQRAGVPELLLSSSGQPGRHQAPVNGKRLLWFSLQSEHTTRKLSLSLPLLPAQAWESRAEKGGKDGRSFSEYLLFLWEELVPLESARMPEHCDLWGGTPPPSQIWLGVDGG